MKTAEEIFENIKKNDRQKELTQNAYRVMQHLRLFSNFVEPSMMEEFFPGQVQYQWERFLHFNRDVLAWYNSLSGNNVASLGNRETFVITLMFGEGLGATKIRSNI